MKQTLFLKPLNSTCSSVLVPANSSRHPISSPSSKKEGKKRKALGSASICLREGKRQLNLKSMLVLPSIKSGKEGRKNDGERVSLTQLQALPLAVQLEVLVHFFWLSIKKFLTSCITYNVLISYVRKST
jgi:hypothetical protein